MKKCKKQGCNNNVFSHLYCKNHQYLRIDKKKPKPIPKRSDKEAKRLVKYSIVRKEYLDKHETCEVCGIELADQIHHKKGRCGSLLTDKRYFLAVDTKCHREIEENPEWAKENEYSLNRL